MMPFTKATAAGFGRKGGQSTLARYGKRHLSQIGARGFASTVNRHWAGDRKGFMSWLRERGRFFAVEAAAEVLLAAGGSCVELDGDLPDELPF
jgi:hypothetical protein